MKTKIQKTIVGGIAGTGIMTLIMLMAPMMGIPKMNPPEMLSGMLGLPLIIGWIMHFMIGIVFASFYVYVLDAWFIKIKSDVINGALFGFIVFVFAQIMLMLIKIIMGGMDSAEGTILLMMMGSLLGHLVYGIVAVALVKIKP